MELHGMEFFAPARFGSQLWLLQKIAGFALNRADRIRALSSGMREALANRYGSHLLARTAILPPRVDTACFAAPAKRQRATGPLRVAMVGAVNANKGQVRLIRALQSSDFPIELHLAGDGPDLEICREAAEAIASRGSLLSVRIHGGLAHNDVADLLRNCDLLIMYSKTEATPRAIMEAMSSGLPVVTTDAGFCTDIVKDGVEGFVLGADPDREILGVLRCFVDVPALASRLGAAARTRATRDYDSVRLFEEYRRLIAETAQS
jgi:glycosyltransferase involved in cell wall biosynthesis